MFPISLLYLFLTQARASTRAGDVVDSQLAMGIDVIIAAIKEDGNAAALCASVVDNVLHERFDEIARDAAGSLQVRAEARAVKGPPAGNFLAIVVGAAVINALDMVEDVGGATAQAAAL